MKALVRFVLLGFLSISSISNAAVGSGYFNVLRVEVTDVFFTVCSESGPMASDSCQDATKVVFWREDYPNGYDSMLSVALAAHMASKKVSMWLDGCKLGPWGLTLPVAASIVVAGN